MAEQVIESLVEGGKATAGPPLGPALGPTGINIKEVIDAINQKTKDFSGMKVPIKVFIDKAARKFRITVGTPPTSQLIKKELGIEKGSGSPLQDKVADMMIEQAIKVAKMKRDSLHAKDMFGAVKTVIGTCVSMGVLIEGREPKQAIQDINDGKFDAEIKSEKTELTAEERKALEEEKKRLAADAVKRHEEMEAKAKLVIEQMKDKPRSETMHKLKEVGVSELMIEKLLPRESAAGAAAAAGAAEGKPVAGAKPGAEKPGADKAGKAADKGGEKK